MRTDFYQTHLLAAYDHQYREAIKPTAQRFITVAKVLETERIFHLKKYSGERINHLQYGLDTLVCNVSQEKMSFIQLLQLQLDTVKARVPDLSFHHPQWFYELEDKFNAVRHARCFWEQRIFLDYYEWIAYYIPLLALLFWIGPYLRLNLLFATSYVLFLTYLGAYYLLGEAFDLEAWISGSQLLLLLLLLLGLLGRANRAWNDYWAMALVWQVLLVLLLGLLSDYYVFVRAEVDFGLATEVLYVATVLGLLGFLSYVYLARLPRR
ncbi:MAG: hypothetical protein AAFW73_26410 [Bacteroidota bacterium]